jgi:hypothetical protein
VSVVVRTAVEVLVEGTDQVLGAAEVKQLLDAHVALGLVLKKVTAKGRARSLLRADLAVILEPLHRVEQRLPKVPVSELVGRAVRRLAVLDLARVPDVVRALAGEVPLAEVHAALLAAHDAGAIELRPEAGSEFLGDEDARLCPPGPRGTVLSYAAVVKP